MTKASYPNVDEYISAQPETARSHYSWYEARSARLCPERKS